jgi:hypothetical protein
MAFRSVPENANDNKIMFFGWLSRQASTWPGGLGRALAASVVQPAPSQTRRPAEKLNAGNATGACERH